MAIEGESSVRDGDLSPWTMIFEFDLGYTIIAVPGQLIADGETITIDGVTSEFTHGTAGPGRVAVAVTDTSTAEEVADNSLPRWAPRGWLP